MSQKTQDIIVTITAVLIVATIIYAFIIFTPRARFVEKGETVTSVEIKFIEMGYAAYGKEAVTIVLEGEELQGFLSLVKDVKLYQENIFTYNSKNIKINEGDCYIIIDKKYVRDDGVSGNTLIELDIDNIDVYDAKYNRNPRLFDRPTLPHPFITHKEYLKFYYKILAYRPEDYFSKKADIS